MLYDIRSVCLLLSIVSLPAVTSGCGDDEPAEPGAGGAVGNGGSGGEFENCVPGTKYPCYTGPLNTKNVGACTEGRATCDDDGVSLGPCEGEILPAEETCLTPEDDDCDGPSNEEGEGCVCAPGVSEACYGGPAGTEGVGTCKGGSRTCDQSGTALSGCIGEILPTAEDCASPADESCEGAAPDGCSGDYAGAALFGDAADQTAHAVAVASDDSYVIAGVCAGAIDFGGGELPALGLADACVARFDGSGAHLWSKRFGAASEQEALGVAISPLGEVVVVGSMQGVVDFGGGPLASAGGTDAYVLRLDAAGNFVGAARFGGVGNDVARALDIGAGGEVMVTGSFEDQIDFGGAPLLSAGGSDIFVAVFGAAGGHISSQRFGDGTATQHGRAITALPGGGRAVAVAFTGSLNFGGGALAAEGGTDIAYAVFDVAGSFVRAARFGDAQMQDIASIDASPTGDLILAGTFSGMLDFGLGNLSSAGEDVYVARIDANGTAAWARRFGDGEPQDGVAKWAPSGDVVVGGTISGVMDFGGGPITSADPDVYVARLDSAGQHQWTRRFGGAGEQVGRAIAVTPSDEHVLLVGSFAGSADLGGGDVTGAGGADVLVLSLVP